MVSAGITCLQGILTDDRMQTNVQGIYAAGDCAEAFDAITGKTMVSAIQPKAADLGVLRWDEHGREAHSAARRSADATLGDYLPRSSTAGFAYTMSYRLMSSKGRRCNT